MRAIFLCHFTASGILAAAMSRELSGLSVDGPDRDLFDWESWAKDALHFKLVRSEKDLTNPVRVPCGCREPLTVLHTLVRF